MSSNKTIASGDRTILPEGAKTDPRLRHGEEVHAPRDADGPEGRSSTQATSTSAPAAAGAASAAPARRCGGWSGRLPAPFRAGLPDRDRGEHGARPAPLLPGQPGHLQARRAQGRGGDAHHALPRDFEVRGLQHLHPGLPHGDRRHGLHQLGHAGRHRAGGQAVLRLHPVRPVLGALPGADRPLPRGAALPPALRQAASCPGRDISRRAWPRSKRASTTP